VVGAVTARSGLPSSFSALRSVLPTQLRTGVELTVVDKPVGELSAAFGGMVVFDTGGGWCTSGWAVRHNTTGLEGDHRRALPGHRTRRAAGGRCSARSSVIAPFKRRPVARGQGCLRHSRRTRLRRRLRRVRTGRRAPAGGWRVRVPAALGSVGQARGWGGGLLTGVVPGIG
jgi:hypothetical protein